MSKTDPGPSQTTPDSSKEKARPTSSSGRRTYVFVGLVVGIAALVFVLSQLPGRSASTPTGVGSAAAVTPSLSQLGPLHPGDTVGDGWKIDRMVRTTAEVQIVASRGGRTFTLGLVPLTDQKDPPIVPFSDVYVWYSGPTDPSATGADPDVVALIQAVVGRLRESAGDRPLYDRINEWSGGSQR